LLGSVFVGFKNDKIVMDKHPMRDEISDFKIIGSSRRRRHIVIRVTQLVLLAVAADIAVLVVEFAVGLDPFADFQQRPVLYLYMFVGTIVIFGVFGAVLGSREAQLEEMAFRDSLTGLLNSRSLHMRLREELASTKRHERPTSFVLFDIDHFKQVNDKYGHPIGDKVLQLIGETIRSTLREGEIAARVGGEEFALLLPFTSIDRARVAAERIREAISKESLRLKNGQQLSVTVSAGVACVNDHEDQDSAAIYSLADLALYKAKKQGRNRVVIGTSNDRSPNGTDGEVVDKYPELK
jgi:diguanylate cyclase (GGDEF)-like protein